MGRALGIAVAAGLFLAPVCVAESKSTLTLTVTDYSVEVGGATPGGRIAILGSDRQQSEDGFGPVQVSLAELLIDEDGDGVESLERGPAISRASVWLAVDVESGQVTSATSWGKPMETFKVPLGLARPNESGVAVVAADGQSEVELLLIRPGVGAWKALGVDGGRSEETGVTDGRVAFLEPAWEALSGDEDGPGDRRATDVLVAFDPTRLEIDIRSSSELAWLP